MSNSNCLCVFAPLGLIFLGMMMNNVFAAKPAPKHNGKLEEFLAERIGNKFDDSMENKSYRSTDKYKEQVRKANNRLGDSTAAIFKVQVSIMESAMAPPNRNWYRFLQGLGVRLIKQEDIARGIINTVKRDPTIQEAEKFAAIWESYQNTTQTLNNRHISRDTANYRIAGE